MRHITVLGLLVAVTGWCSMLAVGVLHSTGALSWTISYDDAVALSALVLLPVLLILGAFATAIKDSQR